MRNTSAKHNRKTTVAKHNCKTKLLKHDCQACICKTQLQDTIAKHTCKTNLLNTIAKHNCKTALEKQQLVKQLFETLLWNPPPTAKNSMENMQLRPDSRNARPRDTNGTASKAIKNPCSLRVPFRNKYNREIAFARIVVYLKSPRRRHETRKQS